MRQAFRARPIRTKPIRTEPIRTKPIHAKPIPAKPMPSSYPTRELCEFLARFTLSDVPPHVVERTKDLFLDWIASALAGKDAPAIPRLQ